MKFGHIRMLMIADSTFTLLFQDTAGSLEFENGSHKDNFLPAVPDGDKLYLNVGDVLMPLSNIRRPAPSALSRQPLQLH